MKKITLPNVDPGRAWAYVGTVLGIAVSGSANYAESADNSPLWMAVGMAAVPLFLFVSLEVLVRNRVREHQKWWQAGLITVAVASGITSYAHMALLIWRHTAGVDTVPDGSLTWWVLTALSFVVPIVPDAAMLLSTLALLLDPNKAKNEQTAKDLAMLKEAFSSLENRFTNVHAENEALRLALAKEQARRKEGQGGGDRPPPNPDAKRTTPDRHSAWPAFIAKVRAGHVWNPHDFGLLIDPNYNRMTDYHAARTRLSRWKKHVEKYGLAAPTDEEIADLIGADK